MSNLNSMTWCKCNRTSRWTSNSFKTAPHSWQKPNWLNLSSNLGSKLPAARFKCLDLMKKTSCKRHSFRPRQVLVYNSKKLANSMELTRLQHRRALWILKWYPEASRVAVQASEHQQDRHVPAIETYRLRTSSSKSSLTWSSSRACRQTMSKRRSSNTCKL